MQHVWLAVLLLLLLLLLLAAGGVCGCTVFHVLTCDASSSSLPAPLLHKHAHFATPVNVCANETTLRPGFGWRLEKYKAHLAATHKGGHSPGHQQCLALVLLIESSREVLVNHLRPHEVQRRWQQLGADVLVATEMTCRQPGRSTAYRACRDERDAPSPLQNNSPPSSSASVYASSAVMGAAEALVDVLTAACANKQLVDCASDDVDEQQVYAAVSSSQLGNWTVKRDVQQRIFGSMAYAQHDACPTHNNGARLASCFEQAQRRHVFHNCCSNHDVGLRLEQKIFNLVGDAGFAGSGGGGGGGDHACDVVRIPGQGLGPAVSGAAAADAMTQFYSKALIPLEAHPLFWHGGGGGGESKPIFAVMSKRVAECRAKASAAASPSARRVGGVNQPTLLAE